MSNSFSLYFTKLLRLVVAATLLSSAVAQAESVYVTDMLRLDMYATEDMSGPIILKLRSGDRMELLSSNGRYAFVRSEDGREGWVKSLYLVEEEPARTRVNKLEEVNANLEATVKKLRAQIADEQARVTQLKQQQDGSAESVAATEQEVAILREENAELAEQMSRYESSVPIFWLFLAMVVALAGGLAGGWFLVDSRSRAKHGGYRIY